MGQRLFLLWGTDPALWVSRPAETRGALFELIRHFLRRMFDGEWSNLPGQWQSVAAGLVAMALPAGMLMLREGSPLPEYTGRYRLLGALSSSQRFLATSMADELALLTILLAVTGLLALVEWQALFRPAGIFWHWLDCLYGRARSLPLDSSQS